jgi:hypothetical protein
LEHFMNRYVGLVRTGDALIPEMVADPALAFLLSPVF